GSQGEILVFPSLADVPHDVRAVDDAAGGREELVVEMQSLDVRRRRVRTPLRRDVDDRGRRLERLAALVRERHVHPNLGTGAVVHRVHFGRDVEPALRDRRGNAGDPYDDRREKHDRHGEDQDRADEFGESRFIFAQDDFHRGAYRWGGGQYVWRRGEG